MTFAAADLAVVIPTRRRWDVLRLTLAALRRQSEQGFETIVVADGNDQEVPDLPGVRVLRQAHAGPGVARNTGVEASDRALVLFIGDDMIPRPELVARHLARHRARPEREVAVLGRSVWHPDVPRDRLHRWLEWSGALFDFRQLEDQGWEDAGWPRFYSSNVSLKRELFLDAGGFDPDFAFDYEDLDLAWRLGQRGLCLHYARDAVTEHLHPYTWDAVRRRYESRAGAEQIMMRKHAWFAPWFRAKTEDAAERSPVSRLWALVVDAIPSRPRRVRAAVEARADRYYLQRLAPAFNAAWETARGAEPRSAPRAGPRRSPRRD